MVQSLNNIVNLENIVVENTNFGDVVKFYFKEESGSLLDSLLSFDLPSSSKGFTLWGIKTENFNGDKLDEAAIIKQIQTLKNKFTQVLSLVLTKEEVLDILRQSTEVFGNIGDKDFESTFKTNIMKQSKLTLFYTTLGDLSNKALKKADLSKKLRLKLVEKNGYLNLPSYGKFIEDASVPFENTELSFTAKELESSTPVDTTKMEEQASKTNNLFK